VNQRTTALLFLLLSVLYFAGLSWSGLLSVDEPRYAAIGRDMALTGNWITPYLWGEPWFEKPPLLFWLIAAATKVGLSAEWAARLPIAALSLLFLGFFYHRLRSLFDADIALRATFILATTAGWFAYSQVAVTDIPLATTFSAAMLFAAPWALQRDRGGLLAAALFFALAILAKAAVPIVLALPLLYWAGRRFPLLIAPFLLALALAVPWYLLCYRANGWPFIEELFLRHHLARFTTGETLHARPFWFYIPVLLAGIFPWTPLLVAIFRRDFFSDPKLRYFTLWFAWGFLFLSASSGKLPGYLLPLLPALAVLLAHVLSRKLWIAAAVLLALVLPVAVSVLPIALDRGLSRATFTFPLYAIVLALITLAVAWRAARFPAIAALVLTGLLLAKYPLLKALDHSASARAEAAEIRRLNLPNLCRGNLRRTWEYQLNYYLAKPLPPCAEDDTTTPRIESTEDGRLVLPR
jgi:4-amino-4-deoxy-L-arabinose transferase-like glycosyltransferase